MQFVARYKEWRRGKVTKITNGGEESQFLAGRKFIAFANFSVFSLALNKRMLK
jgi:hypothetical protein